MNEAITITLNEKNTSELLTFGELNFTPADSTGLIFVMNSDSDVFISDYAFRNNTNLVTVTILSKVKSIGIGAFADCSNLTNVFISADSELVIIPDFVFQNCSKLKGIVLPNNIEIIGMQSFENCDDFEYINIPEKVRKIGTGAFACNKLLNLNLDNYFKNMNVDLENYFFKNYFTDLDSK
jgi:hypothetical protein